MQALDVAIVILFLVGMPLLGLPGDARRRRVRFGDGMRATASVTFQFTRLLADGIRLFATAIPIKVVLASFGVSGVCGANH